MFRASFFSVFIVLPSTFGIFCSYNISIYIPNSHESFFLNFTLKINIFFSFKICLDSFMLLIYFPSLILCMEFFLFLKLQISFIIKCLFKLQIENYWILLMSNDCVIKFIYFSSKNILTRIYFLTDLIGWEQETLFFVMLLGILPETQEVTLRLHLWQ